MNDVIEAPSKDWVYVGDIPKGWKDGRPLVGGWYDGITGEWRTTHTHWKHNNIVAVNWVRLP